jgi:hypothetical protein
MSEAGDVNHGLTLIVVIWVLAGISIAVLACGLYARTVIHHHIYLSDYLMIISLVSLSALSK